MGCKMTNGKKVVFIGDAGVGKSSLLKKFFGENIYDLKSTIGLDFYTYSREGDTIIFWDFAGQKTFRNLLLNFVRGASVVILVFDLARPRTLMSLMEFWIPKIRNYIRKDAKFILVGNKLDKKKINGDLINSFIEKLEKEHHIKPEVYLETSALLNQNIDELFKLINKIYSLKSKV